MNCMRFRWDDTIVITLSLVLVYLSALMNAAAFGVMCRCFTFSLFV